MNISQLTHPTIWGGVLYLGIISTAGGFLLGIVDYKCSMPLVGGIFLFFQPVVGTLLGWVSSRRENRCNVLDGLHPDSYWCFIGYYGEK